MLDRVQSIATPTLELETRFSPVGDDGEVRGVAVKFGVVDSYRSEFAPTAFTFTGKSVPMLFGHDPHQVIGSWSKFEARDGGLVAVGKLNLAVARALEVRALLQAGDLSGLSIGFRTVKDERRGAVRVITQADLREISIVPFPAVPGSGVTSVRHDRHDALSAFTRAVGATTAALTGKRK